MGRSVTPTFRVEVKDNVSPNRWIVLTWRGRATANKLFNWVHQYNASHTAGGCNFHITTAYRESGALPCGGVVYITEARIIRQSTGEIEHTYSLHTDGFGCAETSSPTFPFTVDYVKEHLPDVPIEIQGNVVTGQVMGRKERFATVYAGIFHAEYSWEAVTRAFNSGNPLIA